MTSNRAFRAAAILSAIAVAGALCEFGLFLHESLPVYRMLKRNSLGMPGRLYADDSILGFSPIPDSWGSHVAPHGPSGPIHFDADGFRAPERDGNLAAPAHPAAIVFGCSYSFGSLLRYDETYPALLEGAWHRRVLNASVTSYGLAQIWLKARTLVPRCRPQIVIVQYSRWLIERAANPFAPSFYGQIPTPYFEDSTTTRTLALHPPVFRSKVFDLDVNHFRFTPSGTADFLAFLGRVGLPLWIHDKSNLLLYRLRSYLSIIPRPWMTM